MDIEAYCDTSMYYHKIPKQEADLFHNGDELEKDFDIKTNYAAPKDAYNMETNYKAILKYIVIILLQVIVILYWGKVKNNYFIDDLYSMGYASSFIGKGDTAQYITTSPDFKFDEWINNYSLKKHLILSDEEKIFNISPLVAIKKLVTGRNYFGLLNIAESIAGYSFVSTRPAVLLNIIFFIISEISLISLLRKLRIDEPIRFLSLVMFGFCSYILSAVEYIRFYMMIIMLMIILLNVFHRLWSATTYREVIVFEIAISILAYLAYKNSELTMVFVGALMVCFLGASFWKKKWKHFGVSIFFCMIGGVYLLLSTNYLDVLLHPYESGRRGGVAGASISISNASFETVTNYFLWVKKLFETYYYCSYILLYLLLGAITASFVILMGKTGRRLSDLDLAGMKIGQIKIGTFCALLLWIVIFLLSCIFKEGFLFSILIVFVLGVVAFKETSKQKLINIRPFSTNTEFIWILLEATIIYTIVCAICGFIEIWRYYCYGFVALTIIWWYLIDRLMKCTFFKDFKRHILIIFTVFVLVNAFIPFVTRNIEYMYEDETIFLMNVENHRTQDVVLYLTVEDVNDRKTYSRHDLYDCVNLMSDESNIFISNLDQYDYDKTMYPNEFLLWSHCASDIGAVINDLTDYGYSVEYLGEDHCSQAYACRLTDE